MRQPDAKWLREMVREVADEPPPELDWQRVEDQVFRALEEPGRPMRFDDPTPLWPRVASIAAVAAGLALGSAWMAGTTRSLPPADTTASHHPVLQVEDVVDTAHGIAPSTKGAELVAGNQPVLIVHEDWARFRMSAGSRLAVERLDDRVDLHLIDGKVEAMVTKRGIADVFTVKVDQMRVAVHGTIFSVERRNNTLQVEVQEGSVAVGTAKRHGSTEGWLVTGPSTGTFSLTDRTRTSSQAGISRPIDLNLPNPPMAVESAPSEEMTNVTIDPPKNGRLKTAMSTNAPPNAPPNASTHASTHAAPNASTHAAPNVKASEPVELPDRLSSGMAAATLSNISELVAACYQNATSIDDNLTIRAQTTITIRVAPDGHVAFARFEPPLAPTPQSCASAVVRVARFPQARRESVLTLPLSL